jgi:DNA gyrase inhibitor GyrI
MQIIFTRDDVTIRDVPATPVAIMQHRGDPATLEATFERFRAWRKAAGLSPETSPTFTVFRSERRPANPADYSMDPVYRNRPAVRGERHADEGRRHPRRTLRGAALSRQYQQS